MTTEPDRRSRQLRKLTEVSRILTYPMSLEAVLDLAVTRAAELLESDKAVLLLANEDGLFTVRASHGLDKSICDGFREQSHESRIFARLDGLFGHDAQKHLLGVPFVVAGNVAGLLAVTRPTTTDNPEEDEWLLSALADQVSVALEKARLAEAARYTDALRTSEKRLRLVLDHSPVVLFTQDLDLRYTWTYNPNPGFDPSSVVGKSDAELLSSDAAAVLDAMKRAVLATGEARRGLVETHIGGQSHWYDLRCEPLLDESDRLVGVSGVAVDVTELNAAQLELRESEERFRLTLEEAPIGMALVGLDGRFLRVNRALCEIVGYSADELIGLTFQAIIHPDDLDADLTLVGQLQRGEIPRYTLGKRYLRKDGTVVDIRLSGSVLRDRNGAPIHYIAQMEDVTEQKRRESEQRFLARIGPVLAASLDFGETMTRIADLAVEELADFCIVECVDSRDVTCIKVTSHDPANAWLCNQLTHVDLDRGRPHLMYSVLETGQPLLLQRPSEGTIASLAQGPEHLAMLRAARIQSVVAVPLLFNERLIGAIALISSTSSRIYAAADVRLAEGLAHRAALSMEKARLYMVAQRAIEARDQILGMVAHDLRNPLSSVLLYSEVLEGLWGQGHELDPRCVHASQGIRRAAERMRRLIDDLLDVASMEAGQLAIAPVRVDAGKLLVDAVDAQRTLAASRSLELRLAVTPSLPDISADRDRILQVLENLLGNAIKFTPGGGTITVSASVAGADVEISVRDTGPGISAEHLQHLFDRFWQAKRARSDGAGLGLAIGKGIVEAHGGHFTVTSNIGEGSVFRFTLPAFLGLDASHSSPRAD